MQNPYARTQYNLEACYKNGDSVGQDLNLALPFYTAAAGQGNVDALAALNQLNTVDHAELFHRARKWRFIYMISLDSPIWKELDSAGSDMDEILCDLMEGKGDFYENMKILGENLSCQACYYEMTAYVLPHLAVLCTKLSLEDKAFLITEIGLAIAAEGVWSLEPDTEAFREFQEGLRGLRRETEKLVMNPDITAILGNNLTQRVCFALSALAILGNRIHAYGMWILFDNDWEDCIGACSCGWEADFISFRADKDDLCMKPIPIASWDNKSMDDEPVWFQGLLRRIGDEEAIQFLPFAYGTCVCPECGKRTAYWEWLAKYIGYGWSNR